MFNPFKLNGSESGTIYLFNLFNPLKFQTLNEHVCEPETAAGHFVNNTWLHEFLVYQLLNEPASEEISKS